ncbi:PH domain-containing protein [Neobacillus sp. Marseille-QA0830]
MYLHIEEPSEKISANSVKVWRITNTIGHVTALLFTFVLLLCSGKFDWYEWISTILYIIGAITISSAIYSIGVEPVYLQRTWRYRIDPQFVQIKHGRLSEKHTLIPMEKVEYVRSKQGPVLRRYDLYSLEVGTTTSVHTIPAIPSEEANTLRAQIAVYAKMKDKDAAEGEKGS